MDIHILRSAIFLFFLFITISSAFSTTQQRLQLPYDFSPPQAFKNTNLLRTIDLTNPTQIDSIALIIENISKEKQNEYFVPFNSAVFEKVSHFVAQHKDKDGPEGSLPASKVEFDPQSSTQYYRILLQQPLGVGQQVALQLTVYSTNVVNPLPASIPQSAKQILEWNGTQYSCSAYVTEKQKTKINVPSPESMFLMLPRKSDGTEDPIRAGNTITYGPYEVVEPSKNGGAPISVRYEYTSPIIAVTKLTREIEVSHWGGNIAFEEKYFMTNRAAKISTPFSRVEWAATNYYNPPTTAIKGLTFNLRPGAEDLYFTDEIGNVSTSRFRKTFREAHLEIKPRYPVFGGWNYSFTLGWNHNLREFLRSELGGEDYVLKVPLMDGPNQPIVYDNLDVSVILPEGATNVKYIAPVPIGKEEHFLRKSFMDTIGRTVMKLSLSNVVDAQHHSELTVTYHLSKFECLRKPFVIFTALSSTFLFSWMVSKIDVRIGK